MTDAAKIKEIHVDCNALQGGDGARDTPVNTIQAAADIAQPGDVVIVHGGVYRENVNPKRGGYDEYSRITYTVAEGEHAIIKGSEILGNWDLVDGTIWHASVANDIFHGCNPYALSLEGDWLERPSDWKLSLGNVYLNGKALYEAPSVEAVKAAERRDTGFGPDWVNITEPVARPEETIYQWHAEVGDCTTEFWVNFHDYDPNAELVEINVRRTCFFPDRTGLNYITVRGFEMAQAACPWAPPTGDQIGLIGPHWAKGWIIENNDIHDARCSAISLGKEDSTGDNEATRWGRKPGYQTQLETVFRARHNGWDMGTIGSHIVRNNTLHDCGQNGVVGHLGCVNSIIENNTIYNIGERHEFFGHEIAGVKLHAAIDTQIRNNHFHDCSLGIWLDWEAQGTRVSSNVFHSNIRDLMIEVTSGPCLVDNNVFGSDYNFDNVAQGTALVHNLFCGSTQRRATLNRFTPYHLPHSTEVAGYACVYSGDDRIYQNIFVGGDAYLPGVTSRGTETYDGAPISENEYMKRVHAQGIGDLELFEQVPQPVYVDGNVYLNGAQSFDREEHRFSDNGDAHIVVTEDADGSVWLEGEIPSGVFEVDTSYIDTAKLGVPRIVWQHYENHDGTPIVINRDVTGIARGAHPVPGPVESLKPGSNRIRLA